MICQLNHYENNDLIQMKRNNKSNGVSVEKKYKIIESDADGF